MSASADLRQQLDARCHQQIERLVAWAEINSGTLNLHGLERMASEIGKLYQGLADSIELLEPARVREVDDTGVDNPVTAGKTLYLRKRPEAPRRVLLMGHMDTVFEADNSFQQCEWLDEERLRGPGTADMKGGLLCMYEALRLFEQTNQNSDIGWDVLINPDEETGSRSSAGHIAMAARQCEIGLVYEPALTDGTLAGARKGTGNFCLLVHGKSAHAGREFDAGRNAIYQLADAMTRLHGLNQKNPNITLNLGRIRGGDALNRVPDLALVKFNVRTLAREDEQWVELQLHELVEQIKKEEGFSAELSGGFTRPPKPIDERQQALMDLVSETGNSLGMDIRYKATGGCCDGNNLKAAGLVNVDTMGVLGANIHSDREFMLRSSLRERALLSHQVLCRWASSEGFVRGSNP